MEITGIGYVGLESTNRAGWVDYATDALGMAVNDSRDDDALYLRMDDRHHRIAIRDGETNHLAYVGWELADHFAFEDGLRTLSDAGYAPKVGAADLEAERGVHGVAQFADPAGISHEIFYGQLFDPGSFVPGRRHAGFLADDHGLGHAVLIVPEVTPELSAFSRDVMGFTWFGHGLRKGAAEFWRGNRSVESHNVAYVGMPGHRGLVHLGIYCRELDDVGIAFDRIQDLGLPIGTTMGRHTQDPVISFYSYTPDGMEIEIIWNDGKAFFPQDTYLEQRSERLSTWGHRDVDGKRPSSYIESIG